MNPRLDTYLAELRERLKHESPEAAAAEATEIRQHIVDSIHQLRADDPSLSEDEATLRALDQFGDIEDYIESRPERVRRSDRLRWSRLSRIERAIAISAIMVAALVVVAAASIGVVEHQNRRANEVLHQSLVLTNFNGPINQTFTITPGTPAIRVSFHATDREDTTSACGNLTITDPTNHVALAQTTGCDRLDTQLTSPASGTWTIGLTLTNFTGNFEMTIMTQTGEGTR